MVEPRTDAPPALQRLKGYLAQDPANLNLRVQVFDAALAAGDRALAGELVEAALRERPEDAGWLHRQASLLIASGQHAEAQLALEALVARGVEAPGVSHNLAYAHFAQGRWEAARDVARPLWSGEGPVADAALALWLRCEHRLDRIDEAFAELEPVMAGRPIAPEPLGVASLMALDAGRLDEARAWADRALQGRADQLEALVARGSVALGDLDVPVALAHLERALAVNGGDGRTWSGVAFAQMLRRDFPAALQAFERAVAGMPDHVGTWIGYGWCHFVAGDAQAAKETFGHAIALDRNVGESHGGLAVALAGLGETAAARAEIDIALKLDPVGLSARHAQALLSGEAADAASFTRMAKRVLAMHPVAKGKTGVVLGKVWS
jgi:tetratricopeptide (TPR) repeat protein